MARRKTTSEAYTQFVAQALADWATSKTPKSKTISKASFLSARHEVGEMIESGDWRDVRPLHLVALYAALHRETYGVEPGELESGPERKRATFAAANALKKHFECDTDEMLAFMRWVWTREKAAERDRREGRRSVYRITWKYQFGAAIVTDYQRGLLLLAGGRRK